MPDGDQTDFGATTAQLSEYLTSVSFTDLPDEAIEREKWHILDTLGCILYGTTTPWVGKVIRTLESLNETGNGGASIPATDVTLPPARATLVTGTASHSMDYDDYCQDAGVHAGSAVIPALLACIETADSPVSGESILTAAVAGVEIGVRTGYGIGRGSLFRGWHIAGWTDAFAGAATTGVLQDLSYEQMGNALALAGTQGAGLMGATYGAEVKRFHMGKAAESGFLAASLAEESLTGDTRIFEERWGGIGTTMSSDYDIPAVTENLGETYEFLDKLTFKPFPSIGQTHPPVTAAKQIIERENLNSMDVSHVTVRTTETAKDKAGWDYEPLGVMSAQANIQYAIAALLLDGDLRINAYTEDAIKRPEILERVKDIEVVADPSLVENTTGFNSRYKTAVQIETVDGDRYENTVSIPLGFPENPMSDEELVRKFREQASFVLPETAVDGIIDFVLTLEEQDDVSELIDLMQ